MFQSESPEKGTSPLEIPSESPCESPLRIPRPHLPWGCSCGDGEDACHAVLSALHTYAHPFFEQRHCNAHFGKRPPRVTFASVRSLSGKPRHKPRTSYFWLTQRTANCKRFSSSQGDSSHGFAGLVCSSWLRSQDTAVSRERESKTGHADVEPRCNFDLFATT